MTPEEARKRERYGLVTVIVELRAELEKAKFEAWAEGYNAATDDSYAMENYEQVDITSNPYAPGDPA